MEENLDILKARRLLVFREGQGIARKIKED